MDMDHNKVGIIEEALSAKDFKILQEKILSNTFPWYLHKGVTNENDGYYQMNHLFYYENKIFSDYYYDLLPLLEKLKVCGIRRIKANLTLRTDTIIQYGMHKDFSENNENCKTGILYLNTNNGKTILEDGREFESKENTMILFPTETTHCGTTNTDGVQFRALINFVWY